MTFSLWKRAGAFALAALLAGCTRATPVAHDSSSPVAPSERVQRCHAGANGTLQALTACLTPPSLWTHMERFQRIADEHPDAQGHGNRDTGTAGYRASVDYVAALMRGAGYTVTIQPYHYSVKVPTGSPELRIGAQPYQADRDWVVAQGSAAGDVTAPVARPSGASSGCSHADFAGFVRGSIALLARGACDFDTQIANAAAAGARAAILYAPGARLSRVRLTSQAAIPAAAVVDGARAAALLGSPGIVAHVGVQLENKAGTDYNVIADSPYGDARHVLVVDAHLDSIFGAGMLDNASGSSTILEIALDLAKTQTLNRLRYIWFGGEEIGLLGSHYYALKSLSPQAKRRIAFDVDVDVTATPNFDILIADPGHASNRKKFPVNVVPESQVGNAAFLGYFAGIGVNSLPASFGNDGTDSNSFSLAGIPNTGILTQQDCCKLPWETKLWGGFLGDYEGIVPGVGGACVDRPRHWCDNLSNNSPFVLGMVSKAVGAVVFKLANDRSIRH